jgi:TatD DNase family protein
VADLTDTHCHIHEAAGVDLDTETRKRYEKASINSADEIVNDAVKSGVTKMICVGTTLEDSELAVNFAQKYQGVWAAVGIHPHEAKHYANDAAKLKALAKLAQSPKVVAIGECGLDYYYGHSSNVEQEKILRFQIELALELGLPLTFHVRDAFDDFWRILDDYKNVTGVVHSFTGDKKELDRVLAHGLYVGQNGIVTFTQDQAELDAAVAIPGDRLLLETDAPFLTPKPFRGTICAPRHVRLTAEFLANLRGEKLEDLAKQTNQNAQTLFSELKYEPIRRSH